MMSRSDLNNGAIAELGIFSAAYEKLGEVKTSPNDPLAIFQNRLQEWQDDFRLYSNNLSEKISKIISSTRKLNKVFLVGYEGRLTDSALENIDISQEIIVIPNASGVDFRRISMNHTSHCKFQTQELYKAWESIGKGDVLFVPYFELLNGSVWVYKYCSPIINEQLKFKARTVIGLKVLSNLDIEPGYEPNNELILLSETNPDFFHSTLSLEPKN